MGGAQMLGFQYRLGLAFDGHLGTDGLVPLGRLWPQPAASSLDGQPQQNALGQSPPGSPAHSTQLRAAYAPVLTGRLPGLWGERAVSAVQTWVRRGQSLFASS